MLNENDKWTYTCPICNKEITENYRIKDIKKFINATHDCPECNGLLKIEPDLSCSDFSSTLCNKYREMGATGSDEEIKKGMYYIEI